MQHLIRQDKTAAKNTSVHAQSSVPKPRNVGHQGTQTRPNDPQVFKDRQATQARQVDPQVLKERGNEEFRNGNYLAAAEIYTEAIGIQRTKMKEHVHHSRDLAILYANRSECFLKTFVLDKALEDAMESVSYDGHWFKAHMKVGKVLGAKQNHEGALQAYTNALNELASETSPEKSQREILASYCFHYMNLDNRKYPLNKVKNLKIATHTWALVTYDFITNGNWNLASFSYIQFRDDEAPCIKIERVNLRPICELQYVKNCAWCIDLLRYFLICGSDYNTMTTYTGDRYFHATIRLCIASESFGLIEYVLPKIVVPKGDQNLQDDKGNTALHTITRHQAVDWRIRLRFVIMLIEAEVNPLTKNNEGKYAIVYLPRNEERAIEILATVMRQQEDVERMIQQQKIQQQQDARKQSQSKPTSATPQGRQPQTNRRQEDDAWKQSYMPKQPSRPAYDKCRKCDEVLEECRTKIKNRTGYAYFDMAKVIRENNHNKERHQKIVDEMLCMITDSIAKTLNPEIPERLAKIPDKYYQRIVTGLVKGENWRQLDVVVDEHRKHHGQTDLMDYAKGIKLPRVIIHSSLKGSHQLLTKIIESMLKSGAVIENEGKRCIQAAVQEEQFKVLETLFSHGACPSHLSVNQGDTPIHAALSIAIERDRGNFSIFNLFLEMFEKDSEKYHMLDPNEQDKNGDSLYHLLAKMKYNSTVQKATELLCDKKISSNVKNNEGKLPIHYLNAKNDRRLQFFRLASVGGPTKISSKKTKATGQQKKSAKTKVENESEQNGGIIEAEAEDLLQYERAEEVPTVVEKPVIRAPLRKEALRRRIEELIYGLDDVAYSKYSSRADNLEKPSKKSKMDKAESQTPKPQDSDNVPVTVEPTVNQEPEPLQQEIDQDLDDDEEESIEEQFQFDPQVFENLEWEVECTADVWKALRDKHVLPELKQRIVCKIQHLAAGEWTQILCKKLHHVPETLRLYEAKITKGGRIIWELAIAFSPRLSESAERILECNEEQLSDRPVKGGKIYSEIIRVWDIVFDHDKIYNSVQRIVKSHTRGESCIIQKKLKGVKHEQYSNKKKRVPRIYAETDLEKSVLEEVKQYFPPASANETEYHILKFYSFSSNLISHILQNIEIKVDFPFRVTDLEHAIINLQSNAPILLLGRSGTGKTTCCLYRLWSRFLWYWTKAKEADAPLLPRGDIYREQRNQDEEEEDPEEVDDMLVEEENVPLDRQISGGSQEGATAAPDNENEAEEVNDANGQKYDHLHQVFITKNAVLCNEVQKNFRELMHACDLAKNHLEAENQNLPNRFQDLNDYQFPLFVTSRQLLLMLDASIDEPYFFDRTEDGSLKVDIQGWTDGDGPLSILPLLQEDSDKESDSDDDEEEEEGLDDDQDNLNQDRQNRKRVPPRRELTYELFAETIWPHMNKGIGKKYHPSLVWTEIMSFIKGSYEALSKPTGYLEKEEYFDLGRKRAPNFSGEREHIYTLFKRYEHARKQKFLFDETDLVRNVYQRVCKQHDLNWVIHQIFVDETQDFTQAELCLLLRLCQNPNDMFLTGDTAQGIMRGISFRFSDLKSLFFYASHSLQAMGKTSGVAIPKQVYQLTHNYRSHAGILSLASSILDVMVEFFPESFDRLNKDQGLFHGPQPVLLESCSFSDLALLLRGNKRKTSHIEFGAHQAILVVNDAARENVPEELQCGLILTIYEAKGLEFDDILLYNFFKDSQASKEWRVVTDFLERLSNNVKTGTESLVTVSTEILQQKDRPRALTFDPNQHKVLNSELKHLYTAVTRARVNVWIFDEDMDKRAPMFEYFKARHLVKAISSDDVQNLSTNGMFAEESTPEEWLKRAQDFMKHNLYEVAAKCYRQGGEPLKEKVAMSHQSALKASRIKDNPAKMREEFMLAAEQYLEVNHPGYAAKCLQNARERELLAHLYEKMGQLEKAAETYRKLRRPIESSACYERLGFFDKAIDTLYEQEMYDMAFDTLKRFRMQKKEFEEKGMVLPQHLKEHAPRKEHTEEQLAYVSAGMYHTAKNVGKMLASLNRLSSIQDRVDFLRKHHNHQNEYMSHAAKILRDNGQENDAAQIYIDQGQIDQALLLARDLGRKDWIGYCLVVESQIQTSIQFDGSAISAKKEEVVEKLKEAFDLFKNLQEYNCYKYGDSQNGAGEASLLLGQLTDDISWMQLSWGHFNKAKPYRNEVAQLDCMNWMVYNSDLADRQNLFQVVKGMQNLYGVLKVLTKPGLEDKHRLGQILRFCGLENKTDAELMCNPTLKPRILGVLKSQGTNINEKLMKFEISQQKARFSIAQDFLIKGKHWYNRLCLEFERQHKMLGQCSLFNIGIKDECQTPCSKGLHSKLTDANFRKLIELDILFVELEYYVKSGEEAISILPNEFKQLQEIFLTPKDKEFVSCKLLLSSLHTRFCQKEGIAISTNSEVFHWKKTLRQKKYLRMQLESMLGARYDRVRDKNNKMREKNVELFMNIIFIMNFFNIPTIPLYKILRQFEQDLLSEYRNRSISPRSLEELGFILEKDLVHCLGRQFLESYEHLSSANNNPDGALRKFSKFLQLERKKNHEPMLPDLNLLMMWIEFFSVTAFCLECKFTTREEMSFVIPASYLSIVNFVDASFLGEQGVPTLEAINRYSHYLEQDLVRNKTESLVAILAGTDKKMNIINLVFQRLTESMKSFEPLDSIEEDFITRKHEYSKERIESITIAERVLVASLVFVCNMGSTVFKVSETHVIGEICKIRLPEHCPERLTQAIRGVQKANGIKDIVVCLKSLLEQREEKLLHCWWQPWLNRRHGIEIDTDIDMSIFQDSFFLPKTREVVVDPNTFIASQTNFGEEETALSTEEKEKIRAEYVLYEEQQKKKKSAQTILNFLKHVKFLSNCQNLRELCEIEQDKMDKSKSVDIFRDIIVNDKICGICGVYFKPEERIVEREQEPVDSEYPVLNQPTSPTAPGNILQKWFSDIKSFVVDPSKEAATTSQEIGESYCGLTPLQKHERSESHLSKQQEFKLFQGAYNNYLKRDVDKMKAFIEMYELRSSRIKKLYPDCTLEIAHTIRSYDTVVKQIKYILENRDWRDQHLHQMVKEMVGGGRLIYEYVLDKYVLQSKISSKKTPVQQYRQEDNYDDTDYYEDLEPVVGEPKTKEYYNSKYKQAGKRRGK
ncbi:TPR and ankyrin repeat-containing protein 1-like isoform X2 [Mytilus trossulus]